MTDKEHYILLDEKQNSFFATSWWLNACCGNDNWTSILSSENKSAFAFHTKQKLFQSAAIPSVLTPYQPNINANEETIKALSKFNFVELYWKDFTDVQVQLLKKYKFEISYKHTRVLDLNDFQAVFQNFKPSLKRQIKKAEENLQIIETTEIDSLYSIVGQVFERQNKKIPFSESQLSSIVSACIAKHCFKIYLAKNKEQAICAALLIVWDNNCCYYLTGGIATEFKNTGAMSSLLFKAIQFAATKCKEFDFCGSTIASIDTFFSTFGAIKKDVLVINKYSNPLQKWAIKHLKK